MSDKESDSGITSGWRPPGLFRFRANPETGGEPSRRYYRAIYSHEAGGSSFQFSIDLGRNVCTFHRQPGVEYANLLRDISASLTGSPGPIEPPDPPTDLVALDFELIGMTMSRAYGMVGASDSLGASIFQAEPPGDWFVIQLFVPNSADAFLLAVNEHIGAGEIMLTSLDSGPSVLQPFVQVFG